MTVAESWEKEKNRKNCFDWDSNSRPGNVAFEMELELPRYVELQHKLDTQSKPAVEEDREFHVKVIMCRGV